MPGAVGIIFHPRPNDLVMSTVPIDNVTSISHTHRTTAAVEHVLVVHYRNLRWEVSCDGITRPMIDWLFSRERAVEHAYEMADELRSRGKTRVLVRVDDGADGWEELLGAREAVEAPRRSYSAAMGNRRLR